MAIILKGSPSASINTSHKLQPKQPGVELLDNGYSRLKIGSTTNLSNLDDETSWIPWSNLPYATPDPKMYTDNGIFYSMSNNNFLNIKNSISDIDTTYPTVKEVRINQEIKKNASDTVDSTGLIIRSSSVGGTNDYIMVLPSFNNGPITTGSVSYLGDSSYTWTYGYINRLNSDTIVPSTTATNKTIGTSGNPWYSLYLNTIDPSISDNEYSGLHFVNTDSGVTQMRIVYNQTEEAIEFLA